MNLLVDGRKALFEGLVDYAGIFPPSSLDLEAAVAEYRKARTGPHAWMLGRFLCTASKLENLAAILTATMNEGEAPWSVGVVFDGPGSVEAAVAFHRYMEPGASVDTVELRAAETLLAGADIDEMTAELAPLADAALSVSPSATPFIELVRTSAWDEGVDVAVAAIARLRDQRLRPVGAKIRTGGLEPAAFPTPEDVARFVVACARHKVPFKATAGLHHPVRHHWDELDVMRHGFLNLLTASMLAAGGADESEVVRALAEVDEQAFTVSTSGVVWGSHRLGIPTVRSVRGGLFPAYGSCSFDEPVTDLVALGMVEGS